MESILTWTTIPRHGSCPGVLLIYPVTRICMGPSLESYWYTQWQEYANKQIKEMFSFTQWLLCLEWDFVFTSFLCWIFDWFDLAQVLFMLASSLWVDTCIILLCLENTISNESSITHLGSYNFLPPLLHISWEEGFDENTHLGLSASMSFSLQFVQLWFSVLISIYCKKKLLWWGLIDALISG